MQTTLTRRDWLRAASLLPAVGQLGTVPSSNEADDVSAVDTCPPPAEYAGLRDWMSPSPQWASWEEVAEFLARWELEAQRSNRPGLWHRLNYVTVSILWQTGVRAHVGIGTADQCHADQSRFVARIECEAGRVLAVGRTASFRSWAVVYSPDGGLS